MSEEVKKPTADDFRALGEKLKDAETSTQELTSTVETILTEVIPSLMMVE